MSLVLAPLTRSQSGDGALHGASSAQKMASNRLTGADTKLPSRFVPVNGAGESSPGEQDAVSNAAPYSSKLEAYKLQAIAARFGVQDALRPPPRGTRMVRYNEITALDGTALGLSARNSDPENRNSKKNKSKSKKKKSKWGNTAVYRNHDTAATDSSRGAFSSGTSWYTSGGLSVRYGTSLLKQEKAGLRMCASGSPIPVMLDARRSQTLTDQPRIHRAIDYQLKLVSLTKPLAGCFNLQ